MQDSKRLELMGKGLAWENVTKAKTNSAGHALLEIAPRIAAMEDESERLRRFAQKMLEGWPEDFGDVDGLTIQDAAVECGLLVGETRHESCGEDCNCASYSTGWRKMQAPVAQSRRLAALASIAARTWCPTAATATSATRKRRTWRWA